MAAEKFSRKGAGSMPRWRSQLHCGHRKELWGISHQITRVFVNSSMVRRAASLPFALYFARCPLSEYGPAVSKYIYIDAFSSQFVTSETLLRYTLNSVPVNNLISGNL
jgi:hypothetical protein